MVLTNDLLTEERTAVIEDIERKFLFSNIGEDSTAALATDTALGSEITRVPVGATDTSVAGSITVSSVISATDANSSIIREAGWNSEDATLIDGCDNITGWTDSADMTISLNNTTYYEGTGSINLTKDGTATANANTYKTVTSADFTEQELKFILSIIDSAALAKLATIDSLSVRYGSDSSNYYEWILDNADLEEGKILINGLNSSNADSTTGTPVITAMDYFYVELSATGSAIVWSDGDFIMDYIQIYDGTQYSRNVVTAIGKTDDVELYLDTTVAVTVTQS